MFNKSERKAIFERLEKLTKEGHLDKIDFFKIQEVMSTKIGLSFETIEDDIYQKHLNSGKYVFLKKHNDQYPDFFNKNAKTFGSIIEGDNLLVLFLLKNIYNKEKNRVDLIYIDPPYNTGNGGFIYNNDYRIKGNDKGLCVVNKEDNFRHSKWLSIMQSRLECAKKLLKETGLIAISIDDNELYHLKLLMDKIFGSDCHKGTIVWKKGAGIWSPTNIRKDHEYILVYEKLKGESQFYFQPEKMEIWRKRRLFKEGGRGKWDSKSSLWYSIIYEGQEIWPINSKGEKKLWAIGKEKLDTERKKGNVWFEKDKNGNWIPWRKYVKKSGTSYLKSIEEFGPMGLIKLNEDLGGSKTDIFDYPKPISLMKHLILHMSPKNGLILDFFAGSGTTACAVAELNKEDDGQRKFVLITNNDGDNLRQIKNHPNINDKNKTTSYCVFQDVLYPRLKQNQNKYDLSCKVFMVDENNFRIDNQAINETFISQQKRYLETCTNLLAILKSNKPDLNKKDTKTKGYKFKIDDLDYGFFQTDLDVNMRFKFKLRKTKK